MATVWLMAYALNVTCSKKITWYIQCKKIGALNVMAANEAHVNTALKVGCIMMIMTSMIQILITTWDSF
jgi:hypothetical protein